MLSLVQRSAGEQVLEPTHSHSISSQSTDRLGRWWGHNNAPKDTLCPFGVYICWWSQAEGKEKNEWPRGRKHCLRHKLSKEKSGGRYYFSRDNHTVTIINRNFRASCGQRGREGNISGSSSHQWLQSNAASDISAAWVTINMKTARFGRWRLSWRGQRGKVQELWSDVLYGRACVRQVISRLKEGFREKGNPKEISLGKEAQLSPLA